jgi:hypothetical protein
MTRLAEQLLEERLAQLDTKESAVREEPSPLPAKAA